MSATLSWPRQPQPEKKVGERPPVAELPWRGSSLEVPLVRSVLLDMQNAREDEGDSKGRGQQQALQCRPGRAAPAPAPAPARLRLRKRLNMSGSACGGWWTTSCAPRAPRPNHPTPAAPRSCPPTPVLPAAPQVALGQRGEGVGRGVLPALLLGLAGPLRRLVHVRLAPAVRRRGEPRRCAAPLPPATQAEARLARPPALPPVRCVGACSGTNPQLSTAAQ
eukprot:COSAG04_NODE_5574_length_1563_cov_1.744536_2_plen_221_part_00